MGKNTDKLFITHSEWSGADLHSAGGGKAVSGSSKLTKQATALPFWTCSISQQPIDVGCGVCDAEGHVFDIKNIMPFILRQKLNPVTGETLASAASLTKLKLTGKEDDATTYIDPVTFKEFQRLSEAVVIKVSGQVYFSSTIRDMCVKPGNMVDLVTDQAFTKQDVLRLQGGVGVIKKSEEALKRQREKESERDLERKRQRVKRDDDAYDDTIGVATGPASKTLTTHHMASSLTSTAVDLSTKSKFQTIPLDQLLRPKRFEGPGYAVVETNLGSLNIELWSKYSPKAVYNFVKHAQNGYYDGNVFHRNVRNFMIQGGDPSGTGRGGESAFPPDGKPFKDETNSPYKFTARGMLAMANKGKNTNTSQFFFTYGRTPHLDGKHTIFGQIVGGMPVLDAMERVPVDSTDRPKQKIRVLGIRILVDPFEEDKKASEVKVEIEDDSPWLKKAATEGSSSVGKYLNAATKPAASSTVEEESNWQARRKNKTSISKSSFAGW